MKTENKMPWCGLSPEMCQLEKTIKRIALPLAIVVMTIYLMHPFEWQMLPTSFLESAIGCMLVWHLDRALILKIRHKFKNAREAKRIGMQVSLTVLFSLVLEVIMFYAHCLIFKETIAETETLPYLKNIIVNLLLFTLVVNGIYEIIFLFERLSFERQEKEEYKKAILETRLENLRNQINPHFLFNTFNALSELIIENPKRASDIVVELSDVYRYVLQSRDKNWELLSREIQITRSYIEIIKIRYEENVKVTMNIDPQFNSWQIPPMSLQMLIENATKHNEISSQKPLHIEIFTEGEAIIVRNNFQPRVNAEESNGVGLKNIQSRYSYLLNKSLEITSSPLSFSVKLPLIKAIA